MRSTRGRSAAAERYGPKNGRPLGRVWEDVKGRRISSRSRRPRFPDHQAGNLTRAAALYRDVLKGNPNNIHALHYLGIVEASVGNLKEAKSLIARSLSGQSPNIPYLENYATVLCQAGDYQSAVETCQQGLRLAPRSASLLYVSAVSLLKPNLFDDFLAQFDKLISVQPNNVVALNERGTVLAQMNKR